MSAPYAPQWALVTGAAQRVGQAIALELARTGLDIVVHYRTSHDGARQTHDAIRALGRRALVACADLESTAEIRQLIEFLRSENVHPDILVHSASRYTPAPFAETGAGELDANYAIHMRAPFLLAQQFGLGMKERGWGRIVLVGDAALRNPYRNYLPYLVTKAGLHALTEALALELAPEVLVNTVAPGTVLLPPDTTEPLERAIVRRTPLARIGTPDDIARAVRHLTLENNFQTGSTITVDGGAALS